VPPQQKPFANRPHGPQRNLPRIDIKFRGFYLGNRKRKAKDDRGAEEIIGHGSGKAGRRSEGAGQAPFSIMAGHTHRGERHAERPGL